MAYLERINIAIALALCLYLALTAHDVLRDYEQEQCVVAYMAAATDHTDMTVQRAEAVCADRQITKES